MSPSPVDSFDAAIVLGAMVRPDGGPSPAMLRRVEHAVALAQGGVVGHLLMTGGAVRHPTPEAHVMRNLALAAGVAAERIMVESASVNTIGNARLCRPIIEGRAWKRLLLVTDACHLPRSLYVFYRLGLRVSPAAAMPQGWPHREWWAAWLRETAAFPWTVLRLERAKWSE
ncbi:MAG: YdcF family protein [Phaeospirillum sp.]|nr:YdcF family protein [Phaeospirillum sp.]